MFKKTAITTAIGLAVSAAAHAQQDPIVTGDTLVDTYRWEVQADYSTGEIETGFTDDIDEDVFRISGSYFFDNVDTTNGPRSEAAFLDHASDVTLFYSYGELDGDIIDEDIDEYGISGRWVTERAGWIFEGSASRTEPDNAELDTYRVGVGKYLTASTTLVVSYINADLEIDDLGSDDTDGFNAGLEHFWGFDNAGGIKLEGNYGYINVDDGDDIDIYNVTGTWYINNDLGIGAGYGNIDDGGGEAEEIKVFAEWFFTPKFAVNLEYNEREIDDTDIESEAIMIGARLRF